MHLTGGRGKPLSFGVARGRAIHEAPRPSGWFVFCDVGAGRRRQRQGARPVATLFYVGSADPRVSIWFEFIFQQYIVCRRRRRRRRVPINIINCILRKGVVFSSNIWLEKNTQEIHNPGCTRPMPTRPHDPRRRHYQMCVSSKRQGPDRCVVILSSLRALLRRSDVEAVRAR